MILNRNTGRSDYLEVLLKKLFPECEICDAWVIDKDGKSPVYLSLPRAEKGYKKSIGRSS